MSVSSLFSCGCGSKGGPAPRITAPKGGSRITTFSELTGGADPTSAATAKKTAVVVTAAALQSAASPQPSPAPPTASAAPKPTAAPSKPSAPPAAKSVRASANFLHNPKAAVKNNDRLNAAQKSDIVSNVFIKTYQDGDKITIQTNGPNRYIVTLERVSSAASTLGVAKTGHAFFAGLNKIVTDLAALT